MSQQIIKTAWALASVLFKVWELSRAKQGMFQGRAGREFRKMSNKIPLCFPKTQPPKPQTLQQSRKASVFFSHAPQTKILAGSFRENSVHSIIPLTGEIRTPTPVMQTQPLPPNLASDKGSKETASLVEQFYLHSIDQIFWTRGQRKPDTWQTQQPRSA